MRTSKTKKFIMYILVLFLILSFTNSSYSGNPFAMEKDNANESASKDASDTIDIDETYPAIPSTGNNPSDGKGISIRHVAHMPKYNDVVKPLSPSQNTDENNAKPTVVGTVYNTNAVVPTVTGAVYNNSTFPSSLSVDNSVAADVYSTSDLALESVLQNTYSVSSEVYGSFSIKNKKGLYTAAFTPKSGKELLSFSHGNARLLMSPLNPGSVSGSVYKNTITYENIYPDTNIRYTLESSWLKEDIIVQKYTGMSDFYFQLSVSNAVYEKGSSGEIRFLEPGSSIPLFYMAKPFAVDKNGNRCDLVRLEITEGGLIKLTVDPDWLKKAVYPIIIDPTIFLPDAKFTRSSIAYNLVGTQVASGCPRYETAKFYQGIMIEEGTTNLFNNASFELGSMSGWDTWNWSGTGSATTTTAAARSGVYGCQLSGGNNGCFIDLWSNPDQLYYSQSYYVKRQDGTALQPTDIQAVFNNARAAFDSVVSVGNGWYLCKKQNIQKTNYMATWGIYVVPNLTVYIDECQVEQKPYATSWQLPGTIRTAENLTIPTAGIISANQGSIEVNAYIDPAGVHSANNPNWSMVFAMAYIQASPYLEKNQISIRRSPNSTSWSVWFSNANGGVSAVSLGSITSAGWYSFGVTWQAGVGGYGYLNGVNKGSVTASYLPNAITATVAQIGSWDGYNLQHDQLINDLRISNLARTATEIQAAYNSDLPLPVDGATTCKMGFDGNLQIATYDMKDTGGTTTTTFTRSSTAYKKDGTQVSASQPRFEAGKFGQAIMMEEGTTNPLAANLASIETGTAGFNTSYVTISRDSTHARHGSYALKAVWNGTAGDAYVLAGDFTLSANTTYTWQAWVYAESAVYLPTSGMFLQESGGGWRASAIPTVGMTYIPAGVWTRIEGTGTTPANWLGSSHITLRTPTNSAGTKVTTPIWYDTLQVELKAYSTSWQLPETSRAAETLTIPTAGVFNKGNWTVELTYTPTSTTNVDNVTKYLWDCYIDANNEYRLHVGWGGEIGLWVKSGGTWYQINGGSTIVGGQYFITVSGDGSKLRFFVNGAQIGSDLTYVEPVGVLPTNMYIGSDRNSAEQANGLIDDLRISNRARSLAEHQAAFNSNLPLLIDEATTNKMNFDGSLWAADMGGTGVKPYWNYTTADLGGGWGTSVNDFNLNMILSKSLFLIPGRGLPIGESITYNSIDSRNGPLGIGWHLGSNTKLIEYQDGSVIYYGGDGSAYVFTSNVSGGYTSPPGIYLTLQKDSPSNFRITDKNQNVYTFQNGKPTQSVDRDNNTTTYTYDSNGRLYQLSDASTRKLTYAYNPSGQLISVADPANHTYQFTYQNNYLTTITDPDNKTCTLGYANGHLCSFTDPLNRVTTFNYNSNGQLQTFRDARTNGQDIYETSFTQNTQNNQIITTVTDPAGHVSNFYHDPLKGNLVKFQDPLGDTWLYTWSSNNLTSSQDAKGSTIYEYDSRGNVTKTTTYVDSDPANNIIKTMTYDDYNQLLEVVDGSGKKTSYRYNNRGNLLSTADPAHKESNGRLYDDHGNVVEYSPSLSGSYNLLRNGSMEIPGTNGDLLANWSRSGDGIATTSLEGFNSHGNSALKISSNTVTTEMFKQFSGRLSFPCGKLTLKADVKLENVQSNNGGAMIKIDYGNHWDCWYCCGSGTVPLILTSEIPMEASKLEIYIGLYNASGTAWFDGVQFEHAYNPNEGHTISAFNSVENGGFEYGLEQWKNTGVTPLITTEEAWGWAYSAKLTLSTSGTATIYQDVPVYSGEPLTFSGMVKTKNASGNVHYNIDYYNASNQLISGMQTGLVTGTQDWTRLSTLANAPSNAKYGRVTAILEGSGTAYFDAIKLVPRNSKKYTYNAAGNYILTAEDALGKQSNSTYNENVGTLLSIKDPLNNTTCYNYDNLNRLVEVTDPLSRHAYYQYDNVSNLTITRDPRSANSSDSTYRTLFVPNNINQLITLTDPLNKITTSTYDDRSGNLTKISFPNRMENNFTYDNANRLTRKTLNDGRYFIYSYDGANNLIGVSDESNKSYSWDYDGAGRLKYSQDVFNYRLDYQWDKSNNLTAVTGTNTGTVQYQYRSDNTLLSVTSPDGGQYMSYYNYDENGRVFQIRYPGSYNYREISYRPNGWCDQIQDPSFPGQYHTKYYYFDNGNISSISSWAGWDSFNYDNNGRLTYWYYSPMSGSPTQENYQYDAAGNLLTKGSRTFTYNNSNQITNAGFTYDNNGNLTSDGNFNYTYDAENKLTQVKRVSDNSVVATYAYDFNGLRKSKTVNGQTTNFNWDASGHMVRESDTSGNTLASYYYDPNGNLVGFKKNTQSYIYHDNLRGDIVSVTDYNGTIQAQYNYDPWGTQTSYSGTLSQPFRYAGYYYDEETGLYYLKNRYYSPALGRFLTKDSYGFINNKDPRTLNLYVYVGNNPVNKTDPTGCYMPGDEDLPPDIQDEINNKWGPMYDEAEANGDKWTMSYAHAQADALRAPYVGATTKGIHTDYDLQGNKYIHHEESDLRFNKNGDLVEHNGRIIGPATGKFAKILQYLKNVKPNFFIEGPGIFVFPPGWENMIYPGSKPPEI